MSKSESKKAFDFTRFKQRHIALKILYFGWDYDGLAAQADSQNTIEHHLFEALTKTCLVESRDSCHYNRCGRTDKGVSSYGQVINISLRSNLLDETKPENLGLFTTESYSGPSFQEDGDRIELPYVDTLNRVLPTHIRALAWSPVSKNFSSRFSCKSRSYCYIFPKGDLSITLMEKALTYIVGEHDFRNLCSFDLRHGVTNHLRKILSAEIRPTNLSQTAEVKSHYSFYEVVIVGQAFLYHQIRCIMTVLFLVGTGKEDPEVFRDLLDINKCPARPNYNRASPMPLSLFKCDFDTSELSFGWIYDQKALSNITRHLKNLWLNYKTKSNMIERVLFDMESECSHHHSDDPHIKRTKLDQDSNWRNFGLECDNMNDKKYIPLLNRPKDETLEEKLDILKMKRKNIDKR